MFEAKILQGALLKKIIEAIRELVTDANLDCNDRGITMQAMDSSHVSLCAILLKSEGFDFYRCDKPFALGVNTPNLAKILKCAGNDDVVVLKCEEETDTLALVFESPSQDRVSDFDFKLMDIESEHLGIPDTEYKCMVRMPSAEFQRIIRDISIFGDSCTIAVTKEGIRFSSTGDLGTGNIMLKKNTAVDKDEDAVVIDMQEPVELNFALRYLNLFTKVFSTCSFTDYT
jgi:proliferating cell nuclear antigen